MWEKTNKSLYNTILSIFFHFPCVIFNVINIHKTSVIPLYNSTELWMGVILSQAYIFGSYKKDIVRTSAMPNHQMNLFIFGLRSGLSFGQHRDVIATNASIRSKIEMKI